MQLFLHTSDVARTIAGLRELSELLRGEAELIDLALHGVELGRLEPADACHLLSRALANARGVAGDLRDTQRALWQTLHRLAELAGDGLRRYGA